MAFINWYFLFFVLFLKGLGSCVGCIHQPFCISSVFYEELCRGQLGISIWPAGSTLTSTVHDYIKTMTLERRHESGDPEGIKLGLTGCLPSTETRLAPFRRRKKKKQETLVRLASLSCLICPFRRCATGLASERCAGLILPKGSNPTHPCLFVLELITREP